MSKRITLNEEPAYVLAQLVQDVLNNPPGSYWPYRKFGTTQLHILLEKLSQEEPESEDAAND